MQCPTLTATEATTHLWDATARQPDNRAPDDHSLRRSEYLPAGTKLSGDVLLFSDDPALIDALKVIIAYSDRLGAERSRGGGQIKIDQIAAKSAGIGTQGATKLADGATTLRLLFRAVEPISIPRTGHPGNIIAGDNHIPGRALFGALAASAIAGGRKPSALLDRRISVGPAWPLPPGLSSDEVKPILGSLQVLPKPLHLQRPKPAAQPQAKINWPHWAASSTTPGLRDCLENPPEKDGPALKRSKDGDYLYRPTPDEPWSEYHQDLELRMRNSRGHWSETRMEQETDLFSIEYLPADTLFVTELRGGHDTLKELLDQLGGLPIHSHLRVGRGGAPLELIASHSEDNASGDDPGQRSGALTVVLETDLIARDPYLAFQRELSLANLQQLLGLKNDESKAAHYSDYQQQVGFNAASGLPQAPIVCIRRGSGLRVEAGEAADALRAALHKDSSLGERGWEGHGRFLIDPQHDFKLAPDNIQPYTATADDTATADPEITAREQVLARAEDWQEEHAKRLAKISRSQWGNLRAVLEALPQACSQAVFQQALKDFKTSVEQRRGGTQWAALLGGGADLRQALTDTVCTDKQCSRDHAQLFIRVLLSYSNRQETTE